MRITLVVYVPCRDGVVLAADSGFETNYAEKTSLMRSGEKVRNINGRFLFSGAGDYALIDEARNLLKGGLNKIKKFEDVKSEFLNDFAHKREEYIRLRKRAKGVDPDDEEDEEVALAATLILAYYNEKEGGNAIVISDDMLITSLNRENDFGALGFGVGETVANLQLSKYRKEEIGIEEGCFIAYKTIKDTMAVVGSALLEPISIYTMDSGGIKAVENSRIAVLEQAYNEVGRKEREFVSDMMNYLRDSTGREKLRTHG